MNLKTDSDTTSEKDQQKSFTNTFLLQISVLTLAALVVMIFIERAGSVMYRRLFIDLPFLFSWIGAIESISWLQEQSVLSPSNRVLLLSSILLSLIVFPTVFLFGWRQRRLDRLNGAGLAARPVRIGSIFYLFSMGAMFFFAVVVGPLTYFLQERYVSTCENNGARLLRSKVENKIDVLTAGAFQYRLLPKREGGGAGSYLGYRIPEKESRTDIAEYTAQVSADTVSYVAESASCSTDRIMVKLDPVGKTPVWVRQGNWGAG